MRSLAPAVLVLAGCAPSVLGLPGRDVLVGYVEREDPTAKETQHFCVIPYNRREGGRYAIVHWEERRRLILWGGADPGHEVEALTHSRRVLDLDKDVVATEKDIGGSTYLVTRAWVEETLRDCRAFGFRYAVAAKR